jgi:hypothetical protein
MWWKTLSTFFVGGTVVRNMNIHHKFKDGQELSLIRFRNVYTNGSYSFYGHMVDAPFNSGYFDAKSILVIIDCGVPWAIVTLNNSDTTKVNLNFVDSVIFREGVKPCI